jgi:hypothetical protein
MRAAQPYAADREPGPKGLSFPIKLRCTSVADLMSEPSLEAGLARALGRAFAHARAALPAPIALGSGVALQPPYLTSGALGGAQAAALLARIGRAIESAARAQSLPRAEPAWPGRPRGRLPRPAATRYPPSELAEEFDPNRFDGTEGTYELPSYDGGKAKAPVVAVTDPLANLRALYGKVIAALTDLISDQGSPACPGHPRCQPLQDLIDERNEFEVDLGLVDLVFGSAKPARIAQREHSLQAMLLLLTLVRARVAAVDRQAFVIGVARGVERAIASAVGRPGADADKTDQDFLQDVLTTLGSYYLALPAISKTVAAAVQRHTFSGGEDPFQFWYQQIQTALRDAFARLDFLDGFYRDPKVAAGFAAKRFAAWQLTKLWEKLDQVRSDDIPAGEEGPPPLRALPPLGAPHSTDPYAYLSSLRPVDLQSAEGPPVSPPTDYQKHVAIAIVQAWTIYARVSSGLALPSRAAEVGPGETQEAMGFVSALLYQLQIEIALLGLWQHLPMVGAAMLQYPSIGKSLWPGKDQDAKRNAWQAEQFALIAELTEEFKPTNFPHTGIEQRVEAWESRIQKLFDEISSAIRREQIAKIIGWLLAGLVLSFTVSAWLAAVIQGSRLVLFVAQGVALTAINIGIAAAQGQKITGAGVAVELGLNLALLGLGELFRLFRGGAEITEQISRSRRLLRGLAEGAGMVTATTLGQWGAAKLLDDQAEKQGGETSATQILTVNFILNTFAVLLGAALHKMVGPIAKGAAAPDANAIRVRAKDVLDIDLTEQAARRWLDLAGRVEHFQGEMRQITEAARRGTLTEDQYKNWQQKGEQLLKDLEEIPALAKVLGRDVDPVQVKNLLDQLGAVIRSPFKSGEILLAQPEFSGLRQVGESITWTYDPEHLPADKRKALEALRARFEPRVLTFSDGGWEALSDTGEPLIQILPASSEVRGLLAPTLQDVGTGPQFEAGLARIRAQVNAPALESRLTDYLSRGTGEITDRIAQVKRVLQILGREKFTPNRETWLGLDNYLKLGGSPDTLTKILDFRKTANTPNYAADYMKIALEEIAQWGDAEVKGMEALYRLRRTKPTGEQIASLFAFHSSEAEGVRPTLRRLQFLESGAKELRGINEVLGNLLSDRAANVSGAIGSLRAAAYLLTEHPGSIIAFEQPSEIAAPGSNRVLIRVHDIRVITIEETRVAGRNISKEVVLATREVKEISDTRYLGEDRVIRQLAKDILNDAIFWRAKPALPGGGHPVYGTFGWLIRGNEIRAQAIKDLQARDPNFDKLPDGARLVKVNEEMRARVRQQLSNVFDHEIIKNGLTADEQKTYKNAFDYAATYGTPFFEFIFEGSAPAPQPGQGGGSPSGSQTPPAPPAGAASPLPPTGGTMTPAGGTPSPPPTRAKQSQRVLAPKEQLTRAELVENLEKKIEKERTALRESQDRVAALETKLRTLTANPVARPPELDQDFRNLARIEDSEPRLAELAKLQQRPGLSSAGDSYLKWLREVWTARAELQDTIEGNRTAGKTLETLRKVERPRAEAALRAASRALKEFLRTEGPNYKKRRATVEYDEITGKARWDAEWGARQGKRPALATDHLVALDRIANLSELTEFLLIYEKSSDAVRAKMTEDLIGLGDIESNLVRMRKDANESKSNKSWNDVTYEQMKKYGYESNDVEDMRRREGTELATIKQKIAEITAKYR